MILKALLLKARFSWRQLYCNLLWWVIRRRVLREWRANHDSHLIWHWQWLFATLDDEDKHGRLGQEIQWLIEDLK